MPSRFVVDADNLLLTDLCRLLSEEHGIHTTYQDLWKLVGQGAVPARRVGRHWVVRRDDAPQIAQVIASPPPATRTHRGPPQAA
jgi:hypothetical protein